jgi:hypothetical protein
MTNLLELFTMMLPALWFAVGSVTLHDVNSTDKCACGTYLNADSRGLYFAYNTSIISIMGIKHSPDIFLYYFLRINDSVIIKLSVKYQHTRATATTPCC